jgi:hypothetical protein
MRIGWILALCAALPSLARADGPKLVVQKEKGLEFSAPAGWSIDILDDLSRAVATDGGKTATLTLQAITKKDLAVVDWVKMMSPGAKPKEAAGWTCGESDAAQAERTATCGQMRDGLLILVGLAAEPGVYKKLSGLKLVQKVAGSIKGLKAPDAGE